MSAVELINPISFALAATASSSTPGEIVIGSMPPARKRANRAGEVEASTKRVTPILWHTCQVNKTTNWVGQNLTLTIEKVAHGGVFVARHDGRVVFVSHVLPGEKVKAMVYEDRGGSFCRAEPTDILEASPDRVKHFWKQAGPGGAGGAGERNSKYEWARAFRRRPSRPGTR